MNDSNYTALYGEMGLLGGKVSALPFFLIALTTPLWWFGVVGIVFFFICFPFKRVLIVFISNKIFLLASIFMLVMALYSVYSFIAWREVFGYLVYFIFSFFWASMYYCERVKSDY